MLILMAQTERLRIMSFVDGDGKIPGNGITGRVPELKGTRGDVVFSAKA